MVILLTLGLFLIIVETYPQLAGYAGACGDVEVFGRCVAEYVYEPLFGRVLIDIGNEPLAVACELQ